MLWLRYARANDVSTFRQPFQSYRDTCYPYVAITDGAYVQRLEYYCKNVTQLIHYAVVISESKRALEQQHAQLHQGTKSRMASFLGMIGIGRTEETFTEKIANLSTSLNPFTSRAFTPTSGLFARAPHSTFVLLIGLHESGKTTLMRDYLSPRPESVQTLTPGRHITLEELKVGPTVFRAYDIGSCRPDYIWSFEEELFERADAVIYFVDAADRETIMESREELIMRGLKADKGGMRRGVPLLVLATKIELEVS